MKRVVLFLSLTMVLVLAMRTVGSAQAVVNQYGPKIDPELLHDMTDSKSDSELFPIIVMMSVQYDQITMNRMTVLMDKKAKREFVVNEMKRFTRERQTDVATVMTMQQRDNSVKDFNQFWIFNGFSCKATKEAIEMLASREDVAMVFSDKERQMIPEIEMTSQSAESFRGNAWNITQVNADDVWSFYGSVGFNGNGIVVAVIDTGVNYNHTDIKNNMWDDGNGNHGYDFVNNDSDPMDDQGHGTHCAGTVAGYGTNGTQTGIAPGAKIMALKVLAASGGGSSDDIVSGIEYAMENGADVMSISLGGNYGGYWYYRNVFETVLAADIPASVAAGNEGDELDEYPIPNNIGSPGNCPPPYLHPDQKDVLPGGRTAVICVGATDQSDVHTYFTSVGPATWASGTYIGSYNDYPYVQGSSTEIGLIRPDVAAPGYQIPSLDYANNTGYCLKNGTSMATPCNAGVIALMLEANPSLTPCEIDSILEYTAVRCEGSTKKNNYTGSGRIDAYAAVSAALGGCDAPAGLTASIVGNAVSLSWETVDGVESYSVYRDQALINGYVTTNSFVDNLPIFGCYSYYVKSNCPAGGNSMASNVVEVNYTYPGPIATNLTGDVNGDQVELSWTEPESESAELQYGVVDAGYYTANYNYWAQKYGPSKLSQYAGMAVYRIRFYSPTAGSYSLKIYNGETVSISSLVASKSISVSGSGWKTITLDNAVYVDYLNPLWITFYCSASSALAMVIYEEDDYENAILLSNNEGQSYYVPSWTGGMKFSASIVVGITDGTYTYNIFNDDVMIAQNKSGSSYSYTEVNEGFHEYHVTTNYYGGESQASNSVSVPASATRQFLGTSNADWAMASNWKNNTLPTASDNVWIKNDAVLNTDFAVGGLYISEDASLVVSPNKVFSIAGDVENLAGIDGIVVESGAALVTNATNLQGTAKRVMTDAEKDTWTGDWHFLSSPMVGVPVSDFTSLAINDNCDLYLYNEPDSYWYNEKDDDRSLSNSFYTVNGNNFTPGRGYLTSFGSAATMSFKGVFNAGEIDIPVTVSSSALNGFNLIGNPYPCSIDWGAASGWSRSVLGDNPYFYIYDDAIGQYRTYSASTGGTPVGTNGIIAPNQAFFVKAVSSGSVIINDGAKTFSTGSFRKENERDLVRILVSGENGSDELLICELEEKQMSAEKMFSPDADMPSLYIRHDDTNISIFVCDAKEAGRPITMAFRSGKAGRFVLSSNADVELTDLVTGAVTDLSKHDYVFEATPSDSAERFVVRLKRENF